MRIMMISSGYYPECCGGVEVLVQILSEGLVSRGHEVTVLCAADYDQDRYQNGVRVIRMKPTRIERIENAFTNRVNRMLQMYNPLHTKRFCGIIQEVKPDVVHLHMARALSMSVLTASKRCGVPVVSTLHEYFSLWNFDPFHRMEDVVCSKPPFYVEWIRRIHRKVTGYVQYVTSPLPETFAAYQKEYYYAKADYVRITNALQPLPAAETARYHALRRDRLPRKYLMISRLMPFKGIEKTLEIFSDQRISSRFELHIAGDGPMRDLVKRACAENGKIFYHGFVIDEEKESLFRDCDVMIFLTSELETYGLVVAEAFQRCMPVVASDVQAMRNIIADGENGLILHDVSVEGFLAATDWLTDGRYRTMVDALSELDWKENYLRMLDAYLDIYRTAVQASCGEG